MYLRVREDLRAACQESASLEAILDSGEIFNFGRRGCVTTLNTFILIVVVISKT